MRSALRDLLIGTALGFAILGIGGRLAMAAVAIASGQPSQWSLGGSMTVIFLGAVSGLAGAGIALASRAATRRVRWPWAQYPVFALALALVTMRGLRGTPPNGHWYFYLLVGLYGLTLTWLTRPRVP
jgi:hypothetical protein